MLKAKTLSLLVVVITFTSCQFNQSVNKDLTTGAYSRGDGLGCGDVEIRINEKAVSRTDYIFGEQIDLIFQDVTGLTRVEGKTFPGLAVHIIKNEKDTVAFDPDLFKDQVNGNEFDPLELTAFFRANFDYEQSDKFEVHVNIWDKKGDGTFAYELPFTVKDNELLAIESKGMAYENIYLWNETIKQPVVDGNVNTQHEYYLLLRGVDGFEQIDGKVYPAFFIEITDSTGNTVLSNPDLFSEVVNAGIDPQELKAQIYAKITFSEGAINNPMRLSAKLTDNNSDNEVSVQAELNMN